VAVFSITRSKRGKKRKNREKARIKNLTLWASEDMVQGKGAVGKHKAKQHHGRTQDETGREK
jgi:hypothetical protein